MMKNNPPQNTMNHQASVADNGFFQPHAAPTLHLRGNRSQSNIVQLHDLRETPPQLHLRLRASIFITPNPALDWEVQTREILERVEEIITLALRTLPDESPQRDIFIAWSDRFRQNPLQTAQQRYHAAIDLEWLLYEQIETQRCLRIAIDEQSVNTICGVLLGSTSHAARLRIQYRAKAQQVLHAEITQHTLQRYRELIEELFYEMGLAASNALGQERKTIVLEGRKTERVCRETAEGIHETYMQSTHTVEQLRREVVQRYNGCQKIDRTHQSTVQGLETIVKGNQP